MTFPGDADCAKIPDESSITVDEILTVVERIKELDDYRQRTFRDELEADGDCFPETRAVIADELEELNRLDEYLAAEADRLDELVEGTSYLSTDQAIRHRDQSVEKIRSHNRALSRFRDEMDALLKTVETNLDRIEDDGVDAELEDSQEHLEAAVAALEYHNNCVEGLEKNLRILYAYLQ